MSNQTGILRIEVNKNGVLFDSFQASLFLEEIYPYELFIISLFCHSLARVILLHILSGYCHVLQQGHSRKQEEINSLT